MDIFITGGTGLVGKWTVVKLSQQGHTIKVLARNAHTRQTDFFDWIQSHGGNSSLVELLDGDLSQPDLGLSDANRKALMPTELIYHMGADFRWGLKPEQAQQVTVEGSRSLIELAKHFPKLTQIIHLSGFIIASPQLWKTLHLNPEGLNTSQRLNEQQIESLYTRYGAYEAAKIESEFLLSHLASLNNIPVTGILLSTVIGHSSTGELHQPHGISSLIKNIYERKMLALPGTQRDWLPLISVDYLVDFITGIISAPSAKGNKYITLDHDTPSFEAIVSLISHHLGIRPPSIFIPKVVLKRALRFRLLRTLAGEGSAESIDFIQPHRFDTHAMQALSRQLNLNKPDIKDALLNTVDYLVANEFRESLPPPTQTMAKYYSVANNQTFIKGDRQRADHVLIHGLPFNSDCWDEFIENLPGTCMAADIPNVSRSSGDFSNPVEWMESLLAPLDHSANLITHSLGTGLALEFALLHPHQVKSLVLISPYFLQSKATPMIHIPLLSYCVKYTLNKANFRKFLVPDLTHQRSIDNAFSNTRRVGVLKSIFSNLKVSVKSSTRRHFQSLLQQIQVPTLILHGDQDPLIEDIPNNDRVSFTTIQGAGHNVFITHPKETLLAISNFQRNNVSATKETATENN